MWRKLPAGTLSRYAVNARDARTRVESCLFHCAASAFSARICRFRGAVLSSPVPQAPLALLASHGVILVKPLRGF